MFLLIIKRNFYKNLLHFYLNNKFPFFQCSQFKDFTVYKRESSKLSNVLQLKFIYWKFEILFAEVTLQFYFLFSHVPALDKTSHIEREIAKSTLTALSYP